MKYLKIRENYKTQYNIGDRVEVNSKLELYPLPDSQVEPFDGIYELMYIPIDKTDIVIGGIDKRSSFDGDDYDGYQTDTFNYMKHNFDKLPPIIFKEEKDGTYSHIDGHHRIIIAKELGRKKILAWVHTIDQSKVDVINKVKPKYKTIKSSNSFLVKTSLLKDDDVYFYKDKIITKEDFVRIWHKVINKEDLKIMHKKFLPYIK